MELIALIVSGLALLAACVCLYLMMQEKKRNQKQKAAMMNYVDAIREDLMRNMNERVGKLEEGVIPDYEKAAAAVQAVNDFNAGIANLLNYDPVSALAAQREKERQGE